jgi:hypothetical protein
MLSGVDAKQGTVTLTEEAKGLTVKGIKVAKDAKIDLVQFAKVGGDFAPRIDSVGLDGLQVGMPASLELRPGDKGLAATQILSPK